MAIAELLERNEAAAMDDRVNSDVFARATRAAGTSDVSSSSSQQGSAMHLPPLSGAAANAADADPLLELLSAESSANANASAQTSGLQSSATPSASGSSSDAVGRAKDSALLTPGDARTSISWREPPSSMGSSSDDSYGAYSSDSDADACSSDTESVGTSGDRALDAPPPLPMLVLQHGSSMTNKQLRKHLQAMGKLPPELQEHLDLGRLHRITKQLQYGRKKQRMHRAMAKYTPHSHADGDTCTCERAANTSHTSSSSLLLPPGARAESEEASRTPSDTRRAYQALSGSDASDTDQQTSMRSRPQAWQRRRRKAWERSSALEDALERRAQGDTRHLSAGPSGASSSAGTSTSVGAHDLPSELPPEQLRAVAEIAQVESAQQDKLVYDVLYENQRGLVLFGVTRMFSASTLLVGDPSPWTDCKGANTALTPATMQVPDPSWEWVFPAWLVDMTSDTDEDGWQYSGNFTGFRFWRRPIYFSHGRGPTKWMRGLHSRAQSVSQKHAEKQRKKEETREDAGLEALLRSARSRSDHWRGVPTFWTVVRRRRWVRLRRKTARTVPEGYMGVGASTRELNPSQDRAGSHAGSAQPRPQTPEWNSSGSSDSDDGLQLEMRQERAVYDARHALFKLLPFLVLPATMSYETYRRVPGLLDGSSDLRHCLDCLLRPLVHVRNPFLDFLWIQRQLSSDDLSFLTNDMRTRERRFKRIARGAPFTSLTRAAVASFNFHQILQIIRLCALDRVKLDLWRTWLGLDLFPTCVEDAYRARTSALAQVQYDWTRKWRRAGASEAVAARTDEIPASAQHVLRSRFYNMSRSAPCLLDVWDVLVVHLNDALSLLDYEASQDELLQLLRTLQHREFINTEESGMHARLDPLDERWQRAPNGALSLPRLDHVEVRDLRT